MIKIEILNDNDKDEYENFIKQDDQTLFYLSYRYKSHLESNIGATSKYLIAKDNRGRTLGALPLMISPGGIYGPVINSLPFFGSNGGLIIDKKIPIHLKNEIRKKLLNSSFAIMNEYRCAAMVIITSPFESDLEFYNKHFPSTFIDKRIGQITHLPKFNDGYELNLLKQFQNPRPRNIRKAQKSGIICHKCNDLDSLKELYELHQINISALGGISKKEGFFKSIPDHFRSKDFSVYIAKLNGITVAALLLFFYNKTIEYFTPAVSVEHRKYQPLSLLIYDAMKNGIEKDYKYWNWGGTWLSQKGVYDFKKRWGTTDYIYHYFIFIGNKQLFNSTKETILKEYPNFYVLPFDKLNRANEL
ncbi:GNAT family N-acetyltransferase [Thermodesulfobacteriota bacterium]